LHNKIQSIDYYTDRLRGFFPKETVENIHGQQNSRVLEKNLLGFFSGKISVLVCSTIIESGLDVSNANCIIINNPQNLGLSQLYQIRGRVGRGFEGC
jgi:transcription-repair coupling factor (superfamily II helicase)